MKIVRDGMDFALKQGERTILESTKTNPMIYVGRGQESVDMYRGNFKIQDYLTERCPLAVTEIRENADGVTLVLGEALDVVVKLDGDCAVLNFTQKDEKINRFWIRLQADKDEHCYGCGEQISYFDLRGRNFPLWSSEPGN